eukprot:gene42805-56898_t
MFEKPLVGGVTRLTTREVDERRCWPSMPPGVCLWGLNPGLPARLCDTAGPMPTLPAPSPLALWPTGSRARIHGVLTDIDDTLTTDGAITPEALAALGDLKAHGLSVIAITGRPVGWSVPFAASWPVDAIVAENGAVLLQNTHQNGLQANGYMREQL